MSHGDQLFRTTWYTLCTTEGKVKGEKRGYPYIEDRSEDIWQTYDWHSQIRAAGWQVR